MHMLYILCESCCGGSRQTKNSSHLCFMQLFCSIPFKLFLEPQGAVTPVMPWIFRQLFLMLHLGTKRLHQFHSRSLDLPRVSNFSPQVCFWRLRGSNFRPLGDSGPDKVPFCKINLMLLLMTIHPKLYLHPLHQLAFCAITIASL